VSLSRRRLLGGLSAAGAAAVVGAPFLSGVRGSNSTGELLPSRIGLPTPFTLPFRVPSVLAPVRSDATGDYYRVTQRAALVEILPGVRTPIWGYEGLFPGPTIRSVRGRRTVVTHRNELPVPVVVHLHGGHTPAGQDGFPADLLYPVGWTGAHPMTEGVMAHGSRDYVYPMTQSAATLWYHDHRMDFTGPAVWRGLAGFHLVSDPAEDALGLPSGDRDVPVMIADRSFDSDGSLRYPSLDRSLVHTPGVHEPYGSGVLGDVILVNGVPWPVAEVPAARHRLRLLNASNARRYRLTLDPPGALVQIGTDGGLLAGPIVHEAVEIAPAQRFDVVVDFGRYRPGQVVTLRNEFGDDTTTPIMRFRIGAAVPDTSRVPDRLASPPASTGPVAVTRDLRFRHGKRNGMPGWTINGDVFDLARPAATARLGDPEIWRLSSDFHHPIHLHLASFQVLSRGIGGPGPYDHGPKDTVDLRPAEQASILVRFTDHAGRYVFHCHNLEHEDMGMMGVVVVRP
jgi:spore coat protein A